MLIRILEVMIPVIAVAGLGYLYSLRYRTDLAAINAISVNVFLPALVRSWRLEPSLRQCGGEAAVGYTCFAGGAFLSS